MRLRKVERLEINGMTIFFLILLQLDLLLSEKEKALSGASWNRSLGFGDATVLNARD